MDPIYYLPSGTRLLLIKLDQQWINMINLDQYLLKKLDIRQISKEVVTQLENIVSDNPQTMESDNFRNLYYYSLFVDEQYSKIRDSIKLPIDSMVDLSWHYSTYWFIDQNPDRVYSLPDLDFKPDNALEQYIMSMIQNMVDDRRWEDEFRNDLVNFLKENEKLVLENIVWFGMFLSTGKTTRNLKPNHAKEINQFLEYLYDQYNLTILKMYNYNHLGVNNVRLYDYQTALYYFNQSIELAEAINSQLVPGLKSNKAIVYSSIGHTDKAKEIYLSLINEFPELPYSYQNISYLLYDEGQYEQAIEYNKKYIENFDNPYVDKFYTLHRSLLQLGKIEEAREILEKSLQIVEDNPVIRNTANVIIIKARQNLYESNFGLAFKLYDEAKASEYSLGFLGGLFNYSIEKIEQQLKYFNTYSQFNSNAKADLLYDITSVIQLADEQGIVQASVEGLWLRGRIYHHFGNLEEAKKDTYNAQKLAHKFELEEIEEQINEYRDTLIDETSQNKENLWTSIKQGVKKLLSLNVSGEIKKEDYELHGVVILSKNGIPLFDHILSDRLESDPALLSGLIAAVSSFMSELFKGKGFLKGISHDDLSLVLEPVNQFVIVSIVEKETYDIRLKTKNYGNKLEEVLKNHNISDHPGEVTEVLEKDIHNITERIFVN